MKEKTFLFIGWPYDDNQVINRVQGIVDEAAEMKGAYFWTPPANADGRRKYERQHTHKKVTWCENNHKYSAEFSVKCSCKNIYTYPEYYRDGNRTTLTAIKNSLKRMKTIVGRA